MGETNTGMNKEGTLMNLAGIVLEKASLLDNLMVEFLEGDKPTDCAESKPQLVRAPLNGIADRLDRTIERLESATKQFQSLKNKIM